jgi:hypothetical protein
MNTDSELIAYMEARSKRRLRILGVALAALLALGGIGWVVKAQADAEARHECEVNEYLGGDDC